MQWTPARMSELEAAVQARQRVVLFRRGTQYVVVAHRLKTFGREDVLVGRLPVTGDLMEFDLGEIEAFEVVSRAS
jgi:hypothetical protein